MSEQFKACLKKEVEDGLSQWNEDALRVLVKEQMKNEERALRTAQIYRNQYNIYWVDGPPPGAASCKNNCYLYRPVTFSGYQGKKKKKCFNCHVTATTQRCVDCGVYLDKCGDYGPGNMCYDCSHS